MNNQESMSTSTLALLRQENRRNAEQMVILPRRDAQPESALFCGHCQRWSARCSVTMCRKAQDLAVMENRNGKGWVPMVPAEVGRGLPEVEAL